MKSLCRKKNPVEIIVAYVIIEGEEGGKREEGIGEIRKKHQARYLPMQASSTTGSPLTLQGESAIADSRGAVLEDNALDVLQSLGLEGGIEAAYLQQAEQDREASGEGRERKEEDKEGVSATLSHLRGNSEQD